MASLAGMERPFDVAVLGVTGFTGRLVLKELVTQMRCSPRIDSLHSPVRVAAGARSSAKAWEHLSALGIPAEGDKGASLAAASAAAAAEGLSEAEVAVAVVEVDVQEVESLAAFCASTRLVLDCVGPFRFYGRQVVAACVASGTDYLDVSGEPEFMERMVADFHAPALDRGALVVSACGFDSVPAELGVQAALRELMKRTGPTEAGASPQAAVSSYLTLSAPLGAVGNFGTWDSLVNSIGSVSELRDLRKSSRAAAEAPGKGIGRGTKGSGKSSGKGSGKGKASMLPQWNEVLKTWVLPFPGADVSVVRRTLAHVQAQKAALAASGGEPSAEGGGGSAQGSSVLREPLLGLQREAASGPGGPAILSNALQLPAAAFDSVRYSAFFTVRSLLEASLFLAFGAVLTLLAQYKWGRTLLLKYPEFFSLGVFSRKGPSQEQMDATTFTMRFDATRTDVPAAPQATIVIQGPELGYVLTPWVMVQCALALLRSRPTLPRGGVLTPAVAFAGTSLEQGLIERGVRFVPE